MRRSVTDASSFTAASLATGVRQRSSAIFMRRAAANAVVYTTPPFDGPERVLEYLSRYTHRIAISNHRLLHVDDEAVTLRYKDYRGRRSRSLTLPLAEFTRRFNPRTLQSP